MTSSGSIKPDRIGSYQTNYGINMQNYTFGGKKDIKGNKIE